MIYVIFSNIKKQAEINQLTLKMINILTNIYISLYSIGANQAP